MKTKKTYRGKVVKGLEILFQEPLGKDGEPLFASQSDLARELVRYSGYYDGLRGKELDGAFNSVRTYLSRVMSKRTKRASIDFTNEIVVVAMSRLDSKHDAYDVKVKIREALRILQITEDIERRDVFWTDEAFRAMHTDFFKAKTCILLLPDKESVVFNYTDDAGNYNYMKFIWGDMIDRVAVNQKSVNMNIEVFVPSEFYAFLLWIQLSIYTQSKGLSVKEFLTELNNVVLKVFIVDRKFWFQQVHQTIVLHDEHSMNSSGFVFHLYPANEDEDFKNKISVAKMSSNATSEFMMKVYPQLKSTSSDDYVRPCLFSMAWPDIERNLQNLVK